MCAPVAMRVIAPVRLAELHSMPRFICVTDEAVEADSFKVTRNRINSFALILEARTQDRVLYER
ncbi:MAG TPA: hypothetical protein VE860_05730 [Chthoniobacterales bacterium]|jgi:hypothetical protein|nr:hypothetical protein [Chthoniobacterales bacterium]